MPWALWTLTYINLLRRTEDPQREAEGSSPLCLPPACPSHRETNGETYTCRPHSVRADSYPRHRAQVCFQITRPTESLEPSLPNPVPNFCSASISLFTPDSLDYFLNTACSSLIPKGYFTRQPITIPWLRVP